MGKGRQISDFSQTGEETLIKREDYLVISIHLFSQLFSLVRLLGHACKQPTGLPLAGWDF